MDAVRSANEEDMSQMPMWKSYLYHLQQQAPKPKRIVSQKDVSNRPPYYGREFHGAISREEADFLLTIGGEGSFLIRESQRAPGQYTLAIRFEGVTKNFKLYYDGQHYVGEKHFDTVQDLVADGLITFYLEAKAADYIAQLSSNSNYAESPYVAYNTYKRKQLSNKMSQGHRGHRRSDQGQHRASDSSNRSSRANIPVEGRLSQIMDKRGLEGKDGGAKHKSEGDSPRESGRGADSGKSVGELADSVVDGGSGGKGQHKPSPTHVAHARSSPTADSQHTYVNQSQLQMDQPPPRPPTRQKSGSQKDQSRKSESSVINDVGHVVATGSPAVAACHINPGPATSRVEPGPAVEIDGSDRVRASSSTNTDGPQSSQRKEQPQEDSQQSLTRTASLKTCSQKMFDDPSHFVTPPSSPQLAAVVDHHKFSNVSWCTDFLEVLGSEKPHSFKLNTFKGPNWCDYCANFLWGLIAQGVKCQDCGFNAHKKCSEKVPNDCIPQMKYVKRIFGVDLTTLVKAQNTLIPVVVEKCVQEVEKRGLDNEGLYRVAGFHDDVEAIKMSFDKDGEMTDISENRYDDVNTITSLLKLYFRLLPIPLITFDVYYKTVDLVKREDITQNKKLDLLRQALQTLPPAHYHTLKYLMGHLHRVTERQSKNMMNSENLAIVLAPTLLRSPETDPLSGLSSVKYERELVDLLVTYHSSLLE